MSQIENINDLPTIIPLITIHGIILMPKARLPIPLTDGECEMLRHGCGYVGVLQSGFNSSTDGHFFRTGCLAKITDMETVQGRLILDVKGVCRFDLNETMVLENTARVSYERYVDDLKPKEEIRGESLFDRKKLISVLKQYFQTTNVDANWDDIYEASDERLIAALSMFCPLEAGEKQAVLEQPTLKAQSQLIMSLLEFNTVGSTMNRGSNTYH